MITKPKSKDIYSFFTRRVITIEHNHIESVMNSLGQVISRVQSVFEKVHPVCSLVISGSLARGEPAFGLGLDRGVYLYSDIDFVILGIDKHFKLNERLRQLSENIYREIGYRVTYYYLTIDSIARLRSFSILDLRAGCSAPVVDRNDVGRLSDEKTTLDRVEILEVIVYRSMQYLLGTDWAVKSYDDGYLCDIQRYLGYKLFLDTLRVALWKKDQNVSYTYKSVFEQRSLFAGESFASEISQCIASREMFSKNTPAIREALIDKSISMAFDKLGMTLNDGSDSVLGLFRREDTFKQNYALIVLWLILKKCKNSGKSSRIVDAIHMHLKKSSSIRSCHLEPLLDDLDSCNEYLVKNYMNYIEAWLREKDNGIPLFANT